MSDNKKEFNPQELMDYLTNKISDNENRHLLCYDEINSLFVVNDTIIDLAIDLLKKANIVTIQHRPYKREFFLY